MATTATVTTLRATRSGDRTMRTLFVLALGIGSALAMGYFTWRFATGLWAF